MAERGSNEEKGKTGQTLDVENHLESNWSENDKIDERENQDGAETTEENMPVFDNILDLFKSLFILGE